MAADSEIVTIKNKAGLELEVMPYGAVIRALRVPDRHGQLGDIVLGYDRLPAYLTDPFYMGAVIGRYANRIARGRFTLAGTNYQLPLNDPPNHLHGGTGGFHAVTWAMRRNGAGIILSHQSPAGSEGYPGNLDVEITYTLNDDNELVVLFHAATDEPTPVNLTQHTYFNLRGAGSGTIHDHELRINADRYLPVDASAIPLGELRPVAGTPFDFTTMQPLLGGRLPAYDHCYVLRGEGALREAAELYEPRSGRALTVLTTEPGMQLYTGQFLQKMTGKEGKEYLPFGGVCLETQHFPDSPNRPSFPSTILLPGETFQSTTVFRFSVR